jgi:virginiamycin A acetyltransferase
VSPGKFVRLGLKRTAQAVALVLTFPFALLTAFGRLQPLFTLFAHTFAAGPGLPGDFLRSAYYKLTLTRFSLDTRISYGTYFVRRHSAVGRLVSIGGYCIIAGADIGDGSQIGSHVLIPGGRHQHKRDENGNLSSCHHSQVLIGRRCWIGDGAIIMANLGADCTIGAGSVVTESISDGVVAVGNPAHPLQDKPLLPGERDVCHSN